MMTTLASLLLAGVTAVTPARSATPVVRHEEAAPARAPVRLETAACHIAALPVAMVADLPVIRVTPETLTDQLRDWCTVRRAELAELGRRSRAYVGNWHDGTRIAEELKATYEEIALR